MNKKIQDQLDERLSRARAARVVEDSALPSFSPDIFETDDQETALVEVNFKDETAWRVQTSDAPKLTVEVMQTLGKPIKTVEMFFENDFFQVSVRDGVPLAIEIAHLRLISEFGDAKDLTSQAERTIELSRCLLAGMITDPMFTYRGKGAGIVPIESRSRVMLDALAEAYAVVNQLSADAIYQVTVRRGVPADAFAITGETFEFYPVGRQKKYLEMSEEELDAEMARNVGRRRVLVPAMIVDPVLSYAPVDEDVKIPEIKEGDPYPVGLLSERFMKTLFNAHRVVNVPAHGVASLQRFLRSQRDEPTSENSDGKPMGKQQRGGQTPE